jgi:hypothetical protein
MTVAATTQPRARAVRMVEIVDALSHDAGQQFTIDDLVHRFKGAPKRIEKLCNKAVDNCNLRTGRNVAGHRVYWGITAAERERVERFGNPTGDLVGYEAYVRSHWLVAECVSWERRA